MDYVDFKQSTSLLKFSKMNVIQSTITIESMTTSGAVTSYMVHAHGLKNKKLHKILCHGDNVKNITYSEKCFQKATEIFGELY